MTLCRIPEIGYIILDCFPEPGTGRWASQNEEPVSPWPKWALTLRDGNKSFCHALTNACPKGPRSSAEARGWMVGAAISRRILVRLRRIPSPVSTFNLIYIIFGTRHHYRIRKIMRITPTWGGGRNDGHASTKQKRGENPVFATPPRSSKKEPGII
jgi:hypothetical protein